MSPEEYEQVVSQVVSGICEQAPALAIFRPTFGRKNKLAGRSGYLHQVDVSLVAGTDIYLLECKRWKDCIGVAEVMVLAARMNDIAGAQPTKRVHAILASTKGASRGAKKLALHFKTQLEIVQSPLEFGMQIGRFISVGMHSVVAVSDSADIIVRKKARAG